MMLVICIVFTLAWLYVGEGARQLLMQDEKCDMEKLFDVLPDTQERVLMLEGETYATAKEKWSQLKARRMIDTGVLGVYCVEAGLCVQTQNVERIAGIEWSSRDRPVMPFPFNEWSSM